MLNISDSANASAPASVTITPTFTAESVLNELKNACVSRKYQSFKDLQPGEYIVNSFSIVESSHGPRVRVDMSDTYVLLPERFTKILTAEKIQLLNFTQKMMIYSGKDSSNRDRLILDFRDVNAYIDELLTFTMA